MGALLGVMVGLDALTTLVSTIPWVAQAFQGAPQPQQSVQPISLQDSKLIGF